MRPIPTLIASALLAVGVAAAPAAWASPTFPATVQGHLSLSYTPDCTICHQTSAGGAGTATKPFGIAMKSIGGLQSGNTATVGPALDALAAKKYDSDHDCVDDITELKDHTDPNAADNPGACAGGDGGSTGEGGVVTPPETPAAPIQPGYGCSASPGGGSPFGAAAAASIAALAFLHARRRRR